MNRRRRLLLAGLVSLGGLASGGLRAEAMRHVRVVVGISGKPGDDFVGALRQALGGGIDIDVVAAGSYDDRGPEPSLIVTVGKAALEAVAALSPRSPVLVALIPQAVYEQFVATRPLRGTALFLGQSFARQLRVIRAAFPGARRLGVLIGPDSGRSRSTLARAARDAGLDLIVEPGDGTKLRDGLRAVLTRADVLLVLPDPLVYNASTIQGILLESYRARMPLVGVSSAYTRAGAVLALGASSIQHGAEAAQLAREMLAGAMPEPRHPEAVEVYVNRQVARSLGIELPDDERLHDVARRVR